MIATATFQRREASPLLIEIPGLARRVQGAAFPASARLTLKSGATPLAPPLAAQIRAVLNRAEPRLPAITQAHIARQRAFNEKQAAWPALQSAIRTVLDYAERQKWSHRKLAAKIGLCPRTWRRIRAGKVNADLWLPKIQAATSSLKNTPLNSQL